jgi:GAF domain-containing protein
MSDSDLILAQARALFDGERDPIANAANLSALIFGSFPDLNWAGFYFVRGDELVLGPFQGKTACVRIARGRGVCGTAWEKRETLVVPDVHAFPGHIACDSASNSEVVVPLVSREGVFGVLDVDSPRHDRFGPDDVRTLETLAALYVASSAATVELGR